jgi:hypothetical protein
MVYVPRQKGGDIDVEWQRQLAAKVRKAAAAKATAREKLMQARALVESGIV